MLLRYVQASIAAWCVAGFAMLLGWAWIESAVADRLLRPLSTLANVVAALREQDYYFRARGGQRGDALGDLAIEINALANDLQSERHASFESAALVRRVLQSLDTPVFAFNREGELQLLNQAGARLLGTVAHKAVGRHAAALGIADLLEAADEQVVELAAGPRATQWMVRRSSFREHGIPHALLLLSDVSLALRREEQQAWQRLVRVLGHEINNSLTPIKSIAGSLRTMLHNRPQMEDFARPLAVIEERAESLNRFLAAYRQLAQLPPPQQVPVALHSVLPQLATLETRLPVTVEPGPSLTVQADKDQLSQAVINLLRNAAEAALENTEQPPRVSLRWSSEAQLAIITITDSGLGIANPSNLFVPFYTTKRDGSGIGLALVKQIADAHHGTVSLAQRPEGGTVAQFSFPGV